MAVLRNLARVRSATVGAGALTLGAAVTAFLTFAQAGVLDGETVSYGIFDYDGAGNHTGSEVGRGVYNAGAGTLTRNVLDSTNGGAALNLSGNEHVFITILTEDMDHASGSIANVGTNTHAQIDTHIANMANPHSVTAAQVGAQPLDATLTSIALLGTAADRMLYTTGVDTWAETGLTAFARSILDDADEATFKATVNLEIGTDVQAYDSTLAAIAGLADAAGVLTNDGAGNLSWAAGGGSLPVSDATSIVYDSGDPTKLMRFEVGGYTTGTTRVITPPDADITLAGQDYANVFSQNQTINGLVGINTSPVASQQLTVIANAATTKGLVIKLALSQSANGLELQNSSGTVISGADLNGYLFSTGAFSNTNFFMGNEVAGNNSLSHTIAVEGWYNLGIGYRSLKAITTGYGNVGLGSQTLTNITTGFHNMMIGRDAGAAITTGNTNVAIGTSALGSLTTGQLNIAIGSSSMISSGTGVIRNIGVGANTLNGVTSNDNTVIGYGAATQLKSGGNNVMNGVMAALPANQTLRINAVTTIDDDLHIGIADNDKAFWGAGADASIYYDGTNLIINPKEVGTGYLSVLSDLYLGAQNIQTDTTTGMKIGTATTQKLALWNAAPIVQPAGAAQGAVTNSTGGTQDGTLVDVTTLGVADPAKINDNFTDIFTLLDAMRTVMVNFGSMKGSA